MRTDRRHAVGTKVRLRNHRRFGKQVNKLGTVKEVDLFYGCLTVDWGCGEVTIHDLDSNELITDGEHTHLTWIRR